MKGLVPATAFVVGIAVHQFFFKLRECHRYPLRYVQALLAALATGAAAQTFLFNTSIKKSILSSISIAGIFLLGLYSSLIVYRLFFNPLNKIPGPYFARLSKFDTVFRNAKLDAYHQLVKLHGKYGKFVRIGPNEVSCLDPAGIPLISGPHTRCTKPGWYDADWPMSSMHSTRDRAFHDRRRRIWAPAFSDRALRSYEPRIQIYNDLLIKQIQAFSGKPLNASKWFNLYSFDVMGELGFGASFNMLERGEEHWAIRLLSEGMDPLGYGLPTWFFRCLVAIPGLTAGYLQFIGFCNEQIDKRIKAGKISSPDITHFLVEAYNNSPNKKEQLPLIQADSKLIIVAGSDTTAITLTHVFYHLAKDPSVMQMLRAELEPLLSGPGAITHQKIQDATYLNGIINETLRLNPPVPSGVPRQVPKEGLNIGDTYLPKSTVIVIPGYAMAREESIYPSCESFIPERWSTRPDLVLNKDAFQPFSSGPYGCIGKGLAYLQVRLITAQLVTLFDVSFAPGEDGTALMEKTTEHFTLGMADLNLVFTKRK